MRQLYVRPHSTSERNQSSGQYSISLRYCPSSKNPLRMLFSDSLGNFGARTTFGGVDCCPIRNIRLSADNSRLIVAFAAFSCCRLSTYLANCSLLRSLALIPPKNGFRWYFQRASASLRLL